ncbi:UDP-N-acetylmuramoyl-L-alanine--D-glutamate ligase [Alicyclobacillus fodiniaquatilis]|uniref:UDP-N-acetylmuramoylalanine--D-glutamate ligase n=1 Tax=Alicyclobacillus fodiniaquatilis TaxID=1661150 RepID=A0ABW4JLL0_9BACL
MASVQAQVDEWIRAPRDVLIIGFAKSGAAAADLLLRHGFRVTVNEVQPRPIDDADVERLEKAGVHFVFGGHPATLLDTPWQFIVKNPGIPYNKPLIAAAVEKQIPLFTEIEVASWFTQSPLYAITGSNGKTTTTTLVGEMLQQSNLNPVVAGNIGIVMSSVVEQLTPARPLVLEVSSFQLLGTQTFHPRIAMLLNFFPAHLDYHGNFEAYQAAKWVLFKNQTSADIAILNRDQPLVRDGAGALAAQIHWFSQETADFADGAAVEDDVIVLVKNHERRPLLPVEKVALKGGHNLANLLAAAAMAQAAGASDAAIRTVAETFAGIEHRLEFVREVAGVRYYNDSKASNPTAGRQGLHAFDKDIIWLAGGLDRGIDFFDLVPDLRNRVKAAVLLGETKAQLKAACEAADVPVIEEVASLEVAVARAHQLATPGDTVLLSPACASWDMFKSFEERGSMFKDAVHRL